MTIHRLPLTAKQLARLRERVRRNSSETEDGCWLWMGSIKLNRNGMEYGRMSLRLFGEKNPRSWSAHVVSFIAFNDGIKTIGKVRAHTCHRTFCVNPKHIVECTQADNLEMSRAAGRLKRMHA